MLPLTLSLCTKRRGNTGIGYQTVLHLLEHGAKVYLACRSAERAQDAIVRLSKEAPDSSSKVVFLPFDLTDLSSAKAAADNFLAKEERLDIVSESLRDMLVF